MALHRCNQKNGQHPTIGNIQSNSRKVRARPVFVLVYTTAKMTAHPFLKERMHLIVARSL